MRHSSLYLSFAGFNIKFNFHQTEYIQEAQFFIKTFKTYFRENLLVGNKVKKTDFIIDIVSTLSLSLSRMMGDNFIEYYNLYPKKKNRIITYYSVSPAQIVVLLRYIVSELVRESGFILHASSVILDNECRAFSAPSGTGKTTIIRLLKPYAQPFSDDELVIRQIKGGYHCYQLPTFYKHSYVRKSPFGYPLKHIYYLKRDTVVKVANITEKSLSAFLQEIVQNAHKKTIHHYFALMKTPIPKILHFSKNGRMIDNALRSTL